MHIKINKGRKSSILNLIELKLFIAYPSVKPRFCCMVMVYPSGMDIWHNKVNIGQ